MTTTTARALPLRADAPAKINLGLFVGPLRGDGRHELATVMQSISLADELTLAAAPAGAEGDELRCEGVDGPPECNLAARALAAFRAATGWHGEPLRLTVRKRIPVAAGLGGGSADAAAALRLAAAASGLGDERLLRELGAALGADVPAQVTPGRWLATGAGERLQRLPDPTRPVGVLVLPAAAQLATTDVYAHFDRVAVPHAGDELARRERALRDALGHGEPLPKDLTLLRNDLQESARALCDPVGAALEQAQAAGADVALVSGSGPTVLGLFDGDDGPARAQAAARVLADRVPLPLTARPVICRRAGKHLGPTC